MAQGFTRRPLANFFIKRDLQIRLITKIVFSVILATAVFAATLLLTYRANYRDAAFYQVTLSANETEIGDRLEIVSIILPSLVISAVVNIVVAFCVGVYASRKYAVPIFKLEQWARLLQGGKITAKLRFREKEEMRELSHSCNKLTDSLRQMLLSLKEQVELASDRGKSEQALANMKTILDGIEFGSEPIEVETSYNIARTDSDRPDATG